MRMCEEERKLEVRVQAVERSIAAQASPAATEGGAGRGRRGAGCAGGGAASA